MNRREGMGYGRTDRQVIREQKGGHERTDMTEDMDGQTSDTLGQRRGYGSIPCPAKY